MILPGFAGVREINCLHLNQTNSKFGYPIFFVSIFSLDIERCSVKVNLHMLVSIKSTLYFFVKCNNYSKDIGNANPVQETYQKE